MANHLLDRISTSYYYFSMFRALRHKNYRNYILCQLISLTGTFIQGIALVWLVYRVSDSVFLLGLVGFLSTLPSFFITPFAGVFIDRFDRQRIVLVAKVILMLQASILTLLTLGGYVQIWHILILATISGVINSIDLPARLAFFVELVEAKEDLSNAIAFNSMGFNVVTLLGPALGGLILSLTNEGICFLLNALSYLPVLLVLATMKLSRKLEKPAEFIFVKEFKKGFRYAFGLQPIRSILLLLMIISIFGMPYQVLLPVFAREILHGGPHTLGFLMGAAGVGSLFGAMFLSHQKSILDTALWNVRAPAILGFSVIAFSLSRQFPLSLCALFFMGFGMILLMASSNSIIQTISEDAMRGRVMSFFVISIAGGVTLGNLLVGWLASNVGAPLTLFLGGMACLSGSIPFFLKQLEFRENLRMILGKLDPIVEETKV